MRLYMDRMSVRNGVWAQAEYVDLVLGDDLVARGIIETENFDSDRASSCSLAERLEKMSMGSSRLSSKQGSAARGSRGSRD